MHKKSNKIRLWGLRSFTQKVCPFRNKLPCETPCYECGFCAPVQACMGCSRPELYKAGRCGDLEHK